MERNKKVRLYYMGRRQKDIHLNLTRWEKFKLDVIYFSKVTLTVAVVVAMMCAFYLAGTRNSNKVEYKTQEVMIDNLTPKIKSLRGAVLSQIKACESGNLGEDDGIIKYDPNPNNKKVEIASIGTYQFKKSTVIYYYKILYGQEITGKEAVLIALDDDRAGELVEKIIFETDKGLDNWLNCARKVGAYEQLKIIKQLEK